MKTAAAARQQQGRVLVVEDERDVADLIRYNLTKEGYDVVVAPTGSDALKQAREVHPDLVLLDIMVPQLNGWEVCRRLKQDADTKNIPVIMVTGRVEEGDKVLGFEMGADDYVTKPFSPRELLARIRAVARRARPGDAEKKPHVQIGELEIDRYRFEVRMKGHPVDLTPKEFELLAILAGAPGRVFGREELLDAVWGRDGFVEPRTVDVHVARLRAKFTAAKLPPPGGGTVRRARSGRREPPALISGTAQLGPMSREMKGTEIDAFEKKYGYKPTPIRTSVDALAVFVNKDNPITCLSIAQVDAIFSKSRRQGAKDDLRTWGQLGLTGEWANRPLSLYGRNSASGTYGFFKEHTLKNGDYKDEVKEQPGSASVVQGITVDRYGIGYSGIGYATAGVRAVPLAEKDGGKCVEATADNGYSGSYPLARFLYVYVNKAPGKPLDPLTREFVKLIVSREGQEGVVKDGYFPIPATIAKEEQNKIQ